MNRNLWILIGIIGLISFTFPNSENWTGKHINTTEKAIYLTSLEKDVIDEINKVRTNPRLYADTYLVPMRAYFKGNDLWYPGLAPVRTKEGLKALNECIDFLYKIPKSKELYPSFGMSKGARDHVNYQGKRGYHGHTGENGSRVHDRISKYGTWDEICGENIFYGSQDARFIVTSLLIDDDVADRGHRESLLSAKFNRIGVASGFHKGYDCMCVITLAASYEENKLK